ncbi:hypothetical protein VW23_008785 [Devosia insulae DS-56]|uniref:DUF4760 domain-containing protein n=1 Tax=Devosia insulae DS-56 TaxID=1116389 RepID=A0A1E5XWE7_9HYPH|nr:hypothetical protein [Devosia insulae]OEO32902.1 hypothetical protein VW23_008785 [Devosia insulae DS-56]
MDWFWCAMNATGKWLYDWQTMVAAIIALIAALWTIGVMRRQMKDESDRHNDAMRRKRLAARAQMPDALSELGAYVRGSASRLTGRTETLPPEPTSSIAALKEVIEFIDDKAAERTFELVSWYQVLRARTNHGIPTPGTAAFPDRMYDTALLQTYINSLFDYARNEADDVDTAKPSREDMIEGLKNAFTLVHMVQHEGLYEGVKATIVHRHAAAV